MKSSALHLLAAIAGCLLLSACASNAGNNLTRSGTRFEVDRARVAVIDRQARSHGAEVFWVNMPRRRIESGDH